MTQKTNNKKYKRVYKNHEEYAALTYDSHMKLIEEQSKIYKKLHDSKNQLSNFYKTKWCDNFAVTGKCVHGSACAYAHHANELRQPTCLFWEYKGKCKLGDTCPYLHPPKKILKKDEKQSKQPTQEKQEFKFYTPLNKTAKPFVPFSLPPTSPQHTHPFPLGTISPVMLPASHISFEEEEQESDEEHDYPSSSPTASSEPIPIPSNKVPQTPFSTPCVGPQAPSRTITMTPIPSSDAPTFATTNATTNASHNNKHFTLNSSSSLEVCSSCSNVKAFDGRCYCCMYHSLVMPSVTFEDQKKLVNNDQDIYALMKTMQDHNDSSHASFYANLLRGTSD